MLKQLNMSKVTKSCFEKNSLTILKIGINRLKTVKIKEITIYPIKATSIILTF